jgi:hypothetical protein
MFYKFDELLARAKFRPSTVTRFTPVAILFALVQGSPVAAQDAESCKAKRSRVHLRRQHVEDMIRIDATPWVVATALNLLMTLTRAREVFLNYA